VQEMGDRILRPSMYASGGGGGRGRAVSAEQQALLQQGAGIYFELCVACHGPDAKGAPVDGAPAGTMKAPALAGAPRVQAHYSYAVNAVMHGLTGPIDGTTYTDVMVPMGTNKDDWIAAITSYVRNSFGNTGTVVSPADVARVRAANRKTPWNVEELVATLPTLVAAQPTWTATASHNPQTAPAALMAGTWNTGVPQQPGMWFQVELPAPMSITEIQFDSPGPAAGAGRGRGGRGTPPAAAPGSPAPIAEPPAGATPSAPEPSTVAPTAAAPGAGGRGAATTARGFGGRTVLPPPGFPRGYTVEVSTDGSTWTRVAEGQGDGGTTVITFKPVEAKFIKITQTATVEKAPAWSIQRLRLYQPPRAVGTR
jgi:mono/diheme cytochrome c family protein